MANKSCEKCGGPLLEEDDKLVCGICGKVYEPERYFEEGYGADSDRKYPFFDTVSLEKFRKINDRLVSSVANESYSLIAALSNGQYCARFTGSEQEYTGQCSVERWCGVEKVNLFVGNECADFAVGITNDGELQTTMTDVQNVFNHIQELGISDMRMKQVCAVSFEYKSRFHTMKKYQEYFVGLDVNGRIVIHNPYAVFDLDRVRDQEKYIKILQEIRSWQPVKHLEYHRDSIAWHLYAVTEDGQPKYLDRNFPAIKQLPWTDIVQFGEVGSSCKMWLGLKKDGSLVKKSRLHGFDIDITSLENVVQFGTLDEYGKEIAFLLRNGDVVVIEDGEKKCIAKNVVAIVERGFVFADGSLHTYTYGGNPRYTRFSGIKLFEDIETIEEEWNALPELCQIRKHHLEKQLHDANSLRNQMQQEVKSMESRRDSLGIFKGKEKKALTVQIEEIQVRIDSQEQMIGEMEANFPDGKPVWNYIQQELINYNTFDTIAYAKARMASLDKPKKDKSVIGSAAIGALIAGPTGAVVGAVYAADKNQRNRK